MLIAVGFRQQRLLSGAPPRFLILLVGRAMHTRYHWLACQMARGTTRTPPSDFGRCVTGGEQGHGGKETKDETNSATQRLHRRGARQASQADGGADEGCD